MQTKRFKTSASAWVVRAVLVAALALSIHWLLSPADVDTAADGEWSGAGPSTTPGLASKGGDRPTRLDALLAWMRRLFEDAVDPKPTPTPFEAGPPLGPPGGLEVVVRNGDGDPIVGACVLVFAPPGVSAVPAGITDAQGHVTLAGLPAAPGYLVVVRWLNPAEGNPILRTVEVHAGTTTHLELAPSALRCEGWVVDAETEVGVEGADIDVFDVGTSSSTSDGAPVPAWTASVFGTAAPPRQVGSARSGPDGRFPLDADSAHSFALRARTPDGREGIGWAYRPTGRYPVRIPVRSPRVCRGVVVDSDDAPQPGLVVEALSKGGLSPLGHATVTDSEGRFALPAVGAGNGTMLVFSGAGRPRFSTRVPFDRPHRVVAPGSATLDVRVVGDPLERPSREDVTHPVGGAHLLAHIGSTITEATTDHEGRAVLAVTDGLVTSLRVYAPGHRRLGLPSDAARPGGIEPQGALDGPLRPGERRQLVLHLQPSALVTGRVLRPAGSPAAHVRVTLHTGWTGPVGSTHTGPDGRFSIAECVPPPPSSARGALARGDGGAEGWFAARVPTDPAAMRRGTIELGDLVLRRGGVVRARVIDADGNPILTAAAGGHTASTVDAEGWLHFVINPDDFVGRDTIRIDVDAPGFCTREVRFSPRLASGELRTLPPIRLDRGVPVAVRLTDADDRPLEGCHLSWSWSRGYAGERTDADGRATLTGAPTEDDRLVVSMPRGPSFVRREALPSPQDGLIDLRVQLPRTRNLVVRIVDTAGRPASVASVLAEAASPSEGETWLPRPQWAATEDGSGIVRLARAVAAPLVLRTTATGFVTQVTSIDAASTDVIVTVEPIGAATLHRLAEVLASIERLRREVAPSAHAGDSESESLAKEQLLQALVAESHRLRGR